MTSCGFPDIRRASVAKKKETAATTNGSSSEDWAPEFIRVWQQAYTTEAVAQHFGITKQSCTSRAGNLRKRGVPLKNLSGRNRQRDYDALAALARELLPSS
jgi:hypothetical protein